NGGTYDEPDGSASSGIFPYPAFELFQKNDSPFSAVFAYRPAGRLNVAVERQAYLTGGEYVSGDYFRGLEVPPVAGPPIRADEDRAGADSVVVLSFTFAQKCFGDVERAVGRKLMINDVSFEIVGVAPSGFFGVDPASAPALFLPLHADLALSKNT